MSQMVKQLPLGDERPFAHLRSTLRGTPLHGAYRRARAWYGSRRESSTLASVRCYCLFLGHARSGHSIVGALLDAHPRMAIADEVLSVRLIDRGLSRDEVLWWSLDVARNQARRQRLKRGRGDKVYSYQVPGQWQGRTRDLRVVGTSDAGRTVRALSEDDILIDRVRARLDGLDLRFIQVIRNPYDNIATMMLRSGRTFDSACGRYFENWRLIEQLRARIGEEAVISLRHEDLLTQPRDELARLCGFLGVEAPDDYLDACASILLQSQSKTRNSIGWTDEERRRIDAGIAEFDALSGYSMHA
jgi:hypothetical protein